jgi:transposase
VHLQTALKPGQWVTASAIARHLGVSGALVRYWIRRGYLQGFQVQEAHYSDERPRKGKRAEWRVALQDWERFLVAYRSGRV